MRCILNNTDAIDQLEVEMALLARRITAMAADKKKAFHRSAYLLLRTLDNHGETGVKRLATLLQLDISTVSRQAALLEKDNLIIRIPNPADKRSYYYKISEDGVKQLAVYKQRRKAIFSEMLKDWSEQDQADFSRLLQKFNQTAHAMYQDNHK